MKVSLYMLTMLASAIMASSCTNSIRSSVTCEGIRSLRIGMSPSEVAAAIGEPQYKLAKGPREVMPFDADMIWDYGSRRSLGGLSFDVSFNRGTLIRVVSDVDYRWNTRDTTIYLLTSDEKYESTQFSQHFPCR